MYAYIKISRIILEDQSDIALVQLAAPVVALLKGNHLYDPLVKVPLIIKYPDTVGYGQRWVDQVRGRIGHAAAQAAGTEGALFAGEGRHAALIALRAVQAQEAVLEDAAGPGERGVVGDRGRGVLFTLLPEECMYPRPLGGLL